MSRDSMTNFGAAKWLCSLLICAALAGCMAATATDTRFWGEPSEEIEIDGYPIKVTVIQARDGVYDVEAGDGRIIGFTGNNEPLESTDRFRRAAMVVMKKKFGDTATISTQSEVPGTGRMVLYIRYAVTP